MCFRGMSVRKEKKVYLTGSRAPIHSILVRTNLVWKHPIASDSIACRGVA